MISYRDIDDGSLKFPEGLGDGMVSKCVRTRI